MPFTRTLLALSASLVAGGALAAPSATGAGDLRVLQRISGPDGGWDYTSFDPAMRRVYVARTDGVTAINADTGEVTPKLLAAGRTHRVLPLNGGQDLLVTSTVEGGALIANASDGAVRATIKTGPKPDDAIFEPTSKLAWVMDNHGGGVTLIDPKAARAVGRIEVPGDLESAVADGHGRVFVNVENLNQVDVLDVRTRKLVASYKLPGCDGPTAIAFVPGAQRTVSACANGVADVLDARSGRLVAKLTIGLRPDSAVYDAKRKLVFVPSAGDGTLAAISAERARVVATWKTQIGARTLALDPQSGRMFLPTATMIPATEPGARPKPEPGSFVVLVMGR